MKGLFFSAAPEGRGAGSLFGKETLMNTFRTAETPRPVHLDFPAALLKADLTAMEMRVYMLLLNRSNLSARSAEWQDGEGRVFICYPIAHLAKDLGCSETCVKKSLNGLEEKDLVFRQRQERNRPTRLYVKLPEGGSERGPQAGSEHDPRRDSEHDPQGGSEHDPQGGSEHDPQGGSGRDPQGAAGAALRGAAGAAPRNKKREIYREKYGARGRAGIQQIDFAAEEERMKQLLRRIERRAEEREKAGQKA
jgi:DNA-binding MarR family transcriptional regulator